MYCTACGQQLFDDARFCHACGTPTVARNEEPVPALLGTGPTAQAVAPDVRPSASRAVERPPRARSSAYAPLFIVALAAVAGVVVYQSAGPDEPAQREPRPLVPAAPVPPPQVGAIPNEPVAPRLESRGDSVAELPRVAPVPREERSVRGRASEAPPAPAQATDEPRTLNKTAEPAPRAAAPAAPAVRDLVNAAARGEAAEVNRLTATIARSEVPRGDRAAARALNAQGVAASQARRYRDAAALFQKAREADPGDPEIRENLGYALMKSGATASAETALLSALETGPRRATAWGSLGFVYAQQGRQEEAIAMLRTAHRIAPDPKHVLDTYTRQAHTEDDPRVRAMLAEAVRRIGGGRGR